MPYPDLAKSIAAVAAEFGGGIVICDRCGCTLDDFATRCQSLAGGPCPGFETIDAALTAALNKETSRL